MNFLGPTINASVKLLPRSEGKIKSYASCVDVRAWSHDSRARDRHLREWIKGDMPICVLPVCTLASFLRTMTCKRRSRAAPRCHPDCKSRVLLESLCNSCQAINECLKCEPSFDKYFVEDEIETSHWPCDRCLGVLKSIKMFWKIIVERLFCINMSKCDDFGSVQDDRTESVKSVAKLWEREIVQQALFVKNVTPLLNREFKKEDNWRDLPSKVPSRIPRPCRLDRDSQYVLRIKKSKSPTNSVISHNTITDEDGKSAFSYNRHNHLPRNKLHRCTSVRVRMVNVACDTSDMDEIDDLTSYKRNVGILQQKCSIQEAEIEELRRENNSLKIELQNIYKTSSCMSASRPIINTPSENGMMSLIPKPFESCLEQNIVNSADSEMIITMKQCKNKNFNHVSLLQVLHKTNLPVIDNEPLSTPCYRKENPIDLLTKVQNTFGEIVKREIRIVTTKKGSKKHDVDATVFRVNNSKSAPSCSTICIESSSGSNFASF